MEPWHADIFAFLELRKNHGNELERARDLFYALWIPDLFMKRVEQVIKYSFAASSSYYNTISNPDFYCTCQ